MCLHQKKLNFNKINELSVVVAGREPQPRMAGASVGGNAIRSDINAI